MDNLPVELRRAILTHLPLPTLRSLRLTSRTWASFGSEYLISPLFTTLPHRDDLPRLLSIASHPVFAPRIQSLQLNAGEVNEYHARHNTYFIQYMRDADERALALEGAWGRYAAVKAEKERHLAAFFQEEGLAEALGKLTNLRALEVSLTRCPFDIPDTPDLDLFREVWKIPSTRLLPRVATTTRFTVLLSALLSSPNPPSLHTLTHTRLPLEFFAQKASLLTPLSQTFTYLTTLNLTLDYSEMPNDLHASVAFNNLAIFLHTASLLKHFALSFQGRKKVDISPLLASFVSLQKEGLEGFREWEKLVLEGISCTESELGGLLVGQGKLREVRLGGEGVRSAHQLVNGGVCLREGCWRGLVAMVGLQVALEGRGDLVGLESGECWVLEGVVDLRALIVGGRG